MVDLSRDAIIITDDYFSLPTRNKKNVLNALQTWVAEQIEDIKLEEIMGE
jgi:hypothetical protein